MSGLDWREWIARAPSLAKITPDALSEALEGFRLGIPAPGLPWLARAIQGALVLSVPVLKEVESPVTGECCVVTVPNKTAARKIYRGISAKADAFLVELYKNSDLLTLRLFDDQAFSSLVGEVERAKEVFSTASEESERLPPRWRDARKRADRVERATLLSPVFELAYGREPTVNTFPGSDGGPWPDFYQRIASLAFDDDNIADRDAVLKEARKADLLFRVTFADGQLPEYPL